MTATSKKSLRPFWCCRTPTPSPPRPVASPTTSAPRRRHASVPPRALLPTYLLQSFAMTTELAACLACREGGSGCRGGAPRHRRRSVPSKADRASQRQQQPPFGLSPRQVRPTGTLAVGVARHLAGWQPPRLSRPQPSAMATGCCRSRPSRPRASSSHRNSHSCSPKAIPPYPQTPAQRGGDSFLGDMRKSRCGIWNTAGAFDQIQNNDENPCKFMT